MTFVASQPENCLTQELRSYPHIR